MRLFHSLATAAALALATASVTAQAAPAPYPNAGTENPFSYSFTAAATGDVTAYFAGSTASFYSKLGLLVNGVDTGITGLRNRDDQFNYLALGTALNFGSVNAGDTLTFYINVFSEDPDGASPSAPVDSFYSNAGLNADGVQHIYSSAFAGDSDVPAGTYVAFEDINGGGDFNYFDETFVFTNVAAVASVPEPATWAMLLTGFGLVGAAARRKRTVAAAA